MSANATVAEAARLDWLRQIQTLTRIRS